MVALQIITLVISSLNLVCFFTLSACVVYGVIKKMKERQKK